MAETTYFANSKLRVTDQQISTKKDTVLIRDISAVQLKSPASARFFGFLWTVLCAVFAAGSYQSGHPGLVLAAVVLAIGFLFATLSGRDVVVTTQGGKQVQVASGLLGEMRQVKDAISRAMLSRTGS
jgi:Family of unknown function (DUF6232)